MSFSPMRRSVVAISNVLKRWGGSRRGGWTLAATAAVWSSAAMIFGVLGACRKPETRGGAEAVARLRTVAAATNQTSATCLACHAEIHAAWTGTDHQLANRKIDRARDEAAFVPARTAEDGGSRFDVSWDAEGPQMVEVTPDGKRYPHRPEMVLGNKPSRQMLVPAEGGRWQPTDLAWHPATQTWFNVFGNEERHRGEWGHWTGRGMNWNSMCAHCHMTGYRKNYDAATDSFHSTWVEQGIGCIQCHGPMPPDHNRTLAQGYKPPADAWTHDRARAMQTCAPCHARNEQLDLDFQPGDNYNDHYRLTLPVDPAVYYPDGQQKDEDFNWTSIELSRMGHAGVTCMDCHDPHSTKTILPVNDNTLCMQCHGAPGRVMPVTGVQAPVIDPTAHSHHEVDSVGNRCVECHMPTTNYMVRSPRRDHGWLKPDPLLTKELGIPNACNRCHVDQTVDWAVENAEAWYGPKLESRQRARTRAIAAAQARTPGADAGLLGMLTDEDIPAWRATLIDLLTPYLQVGGDGMERVRAALTEKDPVVRAAATRALAGHPEAKAWLRPLLQDPVKVVRLDAAWALADELTPGSAVEKEFKDYLAVAADQPGGQVRIAQYLANLGRYDEAEAAARKAVPWDPYAGGILETLGTIQQAAGKIGRRRRRFTGRGR